METNRDKFLQEQMLRKQIRKAIAVVKQKRKAAVERVRKHVQKSRH